MGVRFAGNILTSSAGGPLPIAMGGTGETTAAAAIAALLPAQTGNSGKVLTTDGTVLSWTEGGSASGDAGDLTGTTLASNVVTSSLTSVGSLAGLTVSSGTVTMSGVATGTLPAKITNAPAFAAPSTTMPAYSAVLLGTNTGGSVTDPSMHMFNSAGATDRKITRITSTSSGGTFSIDYINDIYGAGTSPFAMTRVGTTAPLITLTSTGLNFAVGTGGLQLNGAAGTSGQVLTSNGSSAAPTWQTPTAAAAAAGTLTGTTLASNVVTSSLTTVGTLGALTVSGATITNGTFQARGAMVFSTANSGVSLGADSNYPSLVINSSASATNQKLFRIYADRDNGGLTFTFVNDAANASSEWLSVTRSGTTPQVAKLTANTINLAVGTGGLQLNGAAGTSGQVLTSNGGSLAPTWQTPTAAAAAAGTLTGTTLASNVVSSSLTTVGTLSALAVTGTTTQTGALNLAGASSPLQVGASAGTAGQVLTSAGAGATPVWASSAAVSNLPRVTSISSSVVGKRVAVSTNQTVSATTWADGGSIAVGDIYSIYNDSSSAITVTAGAGLTMYKDGVAASVGSVTLAARGSCTIWYNTVTEVVINGSIV